jgi:hypothetical protein
VPHSHLPPKRGYLNKGISMIGTRVRSGVGYTDVARRTWSNETPIESLCDQPHSPKKPSGRSTIWRTGEALSEARGIGLQYDASRPIGMLKTRCQADPRLRDYAAKLSSRFRTYLCLCLCLGLSPTLVQAIENALHSTYGTLAFPARFGPCAVYIYCIEAE